MSTPEERRAFGKRVAGLRKQRGVTQDELAASIGRTASWLSQVERGVQPVNRLDVLRLLAEGLGVSVQALRSDAPLDTTGTEDGEPNDLDQARLLLSGHPVPSLLLGGHPTGVPTDLPELRLSVEHIWELTHESRFADLSTALASLVPRIERAVRTAPSEEQPELWLLLSRSYQALSAAFVRQDEADAAWVAADRAIWTAEQSGEPLQVLASVFRLAQAFVRLRRLDQAEHTATTAVAALNDSVQQSGPEALSLLGSLHLALATVHGRAGDRAAALDALDQARRVAQRIGTDRNDFGTEFGPTNVEIQAVSLAVELGDAGEAIETGRRIDPTHLSVERRARLLMDIGRAYAQRRQGGEALAHLLQAEAIAPELIRTHAAARAAIRELVLVAGQAAPPELIALAERADARP
ncbi:helix-turn-helix domain-containing protein [Kitasatospora kifunensis]|uniref:Transcriptional regulator with XRE-family HTH domain n=1 Tax=Kitasatospora kifunensis TaxID=58351 RepID=A0A7W7R186_KITKI|nr:helix-turn-helix transcriptional regulator [Kitasatospora kifunensis]MBB4923560.1 transcriptional regulator with XRE-family HTH domain [Kitasatospora kifunensis]